MQRVPSVATLARIAHDDAIWAVAFSPDGQLATASGDDTARFWSTALDDMLHRDRSHAQSADEAESMARTHPLT